MDRKQELLKKIKQLESRLEKVEQINQKQDKEIT